MDWRMVGILCAAISFVEIASADEGFGDLTGRVVVAGDVPKLPVLGKGICAGSDVENDTLLVHATNRGLANAVIFLPRAPDVIHADLKKPAAADVVFDQKNCTFTPHVLIVQNSQKVRVLSDDPMVHNTRSSPVRNKSFNFVLSPGDRDGTLLDLPLAELIPFKVTCDIHPWMSAYWLVVDHPYAAVTDANGRFTIKRLPAGEHQFVVWHERCGYIQNRREPLDVTIESGKATDAGTISVAGTRLK